MHDTLERTAPANTPGETVAPSPCWRPAPLLAILVGAGAIRFAGLGSQSLWYDEYVTTKDITGGITGLWGRLSDTEGAPPGYFALATLWTHLFGSGDAAIRSLSAAAGTATVLFAALIAHELGCSRRIMLIAAALTAVNPFLVWYSQEARPYALSTLLAAVSLYTFARAFRRGGVANLVIFGIASGVLLATQYFGIFLIVPEAVALVAVRFRRWKELLIGMFFIAWAIAGMYPLARRQQKTGHQGWIRAWPLHFRLTEAARHSIVGIGVTSPVLWWTGAAALLVAVALLALRTDAHERRMAALVLFIGATAVFAPIVTQRDYFIDRNIVAALIPLIVVVAIGLGARNASWPGLAATAGILVVCLSSIVVARATPHAGRADWGSLAGAITRVPGDRVVVFNTGGLLTDPLLRYLPNARTISGNDTVEVRELDFVTRQGAPKRCDELYGQSCLLFSVPNAPPMLYWETFPLTQKTASADFRVDRYTSAQPRVVQAGQLADTSVNTDAVVFYVPGR